MNASFSLAVLFVVREIPHCDQLIVEFLFMDDKFKSKASCLDHMIEKVNHLIVNDDQSFKVDLKVLLVDHSNRELTFQDRVFDKIDVLKELTL